MLLMLQEVTTTTTIVQRHWILILTRENNFFFQYWLLFKGGFMLLCHPFPPYPSVFPVTLPTRGRCHSPHPVRTTSPVLSSAVTQGGGGGAGGRDKGGALARWVRAGCAPGIFFDPRPTSDLFRGCTEGVRGQCNYLHV